MTSPNAPHLIPISDIVDMLSDRIRGLAVELLPNGVKEGHEWRCGGLGGEKGRSLAVHLSSPRAGIWADFCTDEKGDALDLVAAVKFGGDKTEAIKWAKGWLGLDGTDPKSLKVTQAAIARRDDDQDAQADAEKKRAAAFSIFLSAQERIEGTPVDGYLRGRGLNLTGLGFGMGALRYAPDLWNSESKRKWDAMVATIVGPAGKQISVHRTWLARQSTGDWGKAPLDKPKMVLGSFTGGFIPLWKGIVIDPSTGEVKKNPPLSRVKSACWVDMTEGVEDGISVILANPALRVIAAVSLGNWANIRLPEQVEGVVLWQQNDAPGSKAAMQFEKVVDHFRRDGKRVRLARAPEGIKDPNDVVRAAALRNERDAG